MAQDEPEKEKQLTFEYETVLVSFVGSAIAELMKDCCDII